MNENGTNTVMPVQPMGPMGGYGGFGDGGGGGWWWIILLFLICGNNGNWGGNGGNGAFPWLLNASRDTTAAVTAGFDNAAVGAQLSSIQGAVTSGFATAEVAACGRAMDAMQTDYNGQIANLTRSFDMQAALTAGMTALQAQLLQCCCDNRLAVCQTNNTIQSEAAANRYAAANNTRDIIDNQTRGNQAILDKLCQLELDGYKSDLAAAQRENNNLQTQILMKDLAASQAAQTAQLVADNAAQTQYVVNRVAPYPIPAYPVSNPFGGCGCGQNGYNHGFGFGGNPFGVGAYPNGTF